MNKYCGNARPYIYALFSASDRAEAETVMDALSAKGHSLWYGDDFDKKEEARLAKAAALLVVISPAFAESLVLKKAVAQATKSNLPIVTVYLEWVKLSPGLSMQLGTNLGVVRTNFDTEEEYLAKLCDSPVLANLEVTDGQKKAAKQASLRFALGAVATVAAMVILVLYRLLMVSPIEEDSELGRLGLSGNAMAYETLYIYGSAIREDYTLSQWQENDRATYSIILEDTGEELPVGELAEVSAFAQLTNLKELCLAGNKIRDLTGISNLKQLKMLDISGNAYANELDLRPLADLPELETLNLAFSWVDDISPLRRCPKLKTLYLSYDRAWQLNEVRLPGVEVIYLGGQATDFESLKAAVEDESNRYIYLRRPITIPAGETLTIPKGVYIHGDGDTSPFVVNGEVVVEGKLWFYDSDLVNNGTMRVASGAYFWVRLRDFINNGDVVVDDGGEFLIDDNERFYLNDGRLMNNGYVMLRDSGTIYYNGGTIENNGYIDIARGDHSGDGDFAGNGNTVTGTGDFTNDKHFRESGFDVITPEQCLNRFNVVVEKR